ncbi:Kef-type K+ transport system, membrane component [Caldisphaera lagunensis DSM 15908]|uniref:Kef-type K+ transport system, membrane component n=1 Tax=Caldisphaera lagunensis (strain DSM 15908 / JCM 11604 / ANMR 0165 / IC-154) TaxID=1056495 RepID=L0A992_CALLD|nr:cation:proton antiporter [Caldisphaera lagunensis]AFZ70441.1 Kef-type K+ transport system, membrane component [Caldisphaera lagunensis DSM 15908]
MLSEVILALLEISLLVLFAALMGSVAIRFKFPKVVGDLLIGIILSPFLIGGFINKIIDVNLFSINNYLLLFSEFSVILLIYSIGLESGVSALRSSGISGIMGAIFGATIPFIFGAILIRFFVSFSAALIIGSALGATSLAVASSLIKETNLKGNGVNFILTAGSFDDVVSLIILSVAIAMSTLKTISYADILRTIFFYGIAWFIIFATSVFIIPKIFNNIIKEKYVFEGSLVIIFALTAIMTTLGFSPIIAAYIAGVAMAESNKAAKLRENTNALLALFGSIFFVTMGAQVNLIKLSYFGLIFSLFITAIAIIFKILGIYPFSYLATRSHKSSLAISIGMIPRGEIGLAVANIGLTYSIINDVEFSSIVIMSLLTTILGALIFGKIYHYIK